ncbi:MAG: CsbD family protein, partial [Bacteroidota bacterium]
MIDRYDDLSYKGEWNEVKGDIQKAWGKLTNSDVDKINGSKTRLLGVIQQRYARSRIDALKEVDQFL